MQATAHSNIKRRTKESITKKKVIEKFASPWLPSRVNNKWPATILAANRIAKVPGRIKDLTVSIKTITGIKAGGVPEGTKWANILFGWKIIDQIIEPSHRGKDKDKVKTKCLEEVKTKGNKPKKFEKIIKKKKVIKIKEVPGIISFLKIASNSKNKLFVTKIIVILNCLFVNQNIWGKKIIAINLEIQFSLKNIEKILTWGSNEEKRLVIKLVELNF